MHLFNTDVEGVEMGEGQKRPAAPTHLEGFVSNVALLEAACSRAKDLMKIDMDLFPANLKEAAAAFKFRSHSLTMF